MPIENSEKALGDLHRMWKQFVVAISLIVGLAGLAGAGTPAERLNNKTAYPIPPPLPLGPAGFTFKDPTFGTTIMRLTDEIDYPYVGMRHVYAAISSPFNLDSTWIFCGPQNDGGHFIEFDPVNFKRGSRSIDIQAQTKMPRGLNPYGGIWSKVDPHIYFSGAGDSKLYAFDVSKPELGWVLFKDLTQLLIDAGMPLGGPFLRISSSWHDDRFALHNERSGVIWSRSLDKLVWIPPPDRRDGGNKGQMDKSGQFYAESYVGNPVFGELWKIDTKEEWPWPSAGHGDMGTGTLVALDDSAGSRITLWELAPNATDRPKEVVFDWSDMPAPVEFGGHNSMQSDLEDYTLWEFYQGPADLTRIYNNEIGLAPTDGSKDVYRLVQHQSRFAESGDYWSQPRSVLSPDGKFAIFDSNWGLRRGPDGVTPFTDVFVIDLRDIPRRTPYRAASPGIDLCAVTLSPSSVTVPMAGGSFQVAVTTGQGCAWKTASQSDWIWSLSAGTGSGVALMWVAPGNGAARQGAVLIGRQPIAVSQTQSSCVYSVSPGQLTVSDSAGTSFIQVSTTPDCAWTSTSLSPWITIAGAASGTGQAALSFSDNPTSAPRLGFVSVGGNSVSVQQSGKQAASTCSYTLSLADGMLPASGGMGSVTMSGGCPRLDSSSQWLTPGIFFFWPDNPGSQRTTILTIGGQSFTLTQAGQ